MSFTRRTWMSMASAHALASLTPYALGRGVVTQEWAAAWQTENGSQVGILRLQEGKLHVAASLDIPSRAHALLEEPSGSLIAIARRPGEWMMRFDRHGRLQTFISTEPERAFNGHVICNASGSTLYTTETDLRSGAGIIGMRDARTLAKLDELSTHGIDPHALLWDEHAPPGTRLVVANGGIETQPETGRIKLNLNRMDSSIVRLQTANGHLQGQWRLQDKRLSLRHMAWWGQGLQAKLGIALQAEHDDDDRRASAPVLAMFANEELTLVSPPRTLSGYAGDITASRQGILVSCPRAHGIAGWSPRGAWLGFTPLSNACALSVDPQTAAIWIGGQAAALRATTDGQTVQFPHTWPKTFRLENHWVTLTAM